VKFNDKLQDDTELGSLNSQEQDDTELGSILARCRANLSYNNSYAEFSRREINMVIHNLAKTAVHNVNSHLYFDIPDCIDLLILNEIFFRKKK
jgi:hypothetical protein